MAEKAACKRFKLATLKRQKRGQIAVAPSCRSGWRNHILLETQESNLVVNSRVLGWQKGKVGSALKSILRSSAGAHSTGGLRWSVGGRHG